MGLVVTTSLERADDDGDMRAPGWRKARVKTYLSIRHVWHQREHRVRAHIFASLLAYALWKNLELRHNQAGLRNTPRRILNELAQVQSEDVVLPTTNGRRIRVRCVARPDQAHAQLLDWLGVELPRRLNTPKALDVVGV